MGPHCDSWGGDNNLVYSIVFYWNDDYEDHDCYLDEIDGRDTMDGDHDSAMTSAGWGTDEDYGYYGDE